MTIHIDGRPSPTALVSMPLLAERYGLDEQRTLASLKRAKVPMKVHAGAAWAPVSHPKVASLLDQAGIGELHLYTAEGGARAVRVPKAAAQAALAGSRQLFSTGLHVPVAEFDTFRATGAARAAAVLGRSGDAGGSAARSMLRAAMKVGPYALGIAPTVYLAQQLAGRVGDPLEPQHDQQVRRAGMLVGGAALAGAGGLAVAHAIRPELPRGAKVATGVALGGAALAAIAASAIMAISGTGTGD